MANQVITQNIDPAMQPYIAYGLSEAQKLYQTPGTPSYFPGQGYVSPSESTVVHFPSKSYSHSYS